MSVDIGNLNVEDDVNVGEINIPLITPKRGVDYWTPADQQAVVNEAVNSVNAVVMPQEETRQANEITRQNNEDTRQANETTRQNNEATRISNEETRIANESERIENETERQETFSGYEARIEGIEDDIEDIQGDISDIQDEQLTQNTNISSNSTAITSLQTNKANKSETYTKTEVDTALSGKQAVISNSNKLASDLVSDTNQTNKFTTSGEKSTWNAKYDKPSGGIPKTDLASDVQTSLGKADTAIQDISGKQDVLTVGSNIQINNNVISATDTTYENATDETSGLMSATDKVKLDGIEAEATKTIVDDELSSSSENPVQNKVINASQEEQNDRIENLEQDVEDLRKNSLQVSGTGTNFKLSNTAKARFIELFMKGNTCQQSYTGKNLFNPALLSQETDYNTYNSTTGLWTTNNGANYTRSILYNVAGNTSARDITKLIKLKANTTYTIKFYDFTNDTGTTTNYLNYALYDNTGTYISNITGADTTTFTTESECYLDIRRVASSGTFSFSKVQLEEGSTATDFEPYVRRNSKPITKFSSNNS